ncbi:hypothetical protein F9L33_15490 [Amylibacter sp. SFDW26]|uniref:hypothetical protein n=1 Tax=Amylibacter sp. SFDW26 TaxID=2652722 RepID=UPI001261B540|nr:hypothetical protein [Amylibacter sp. SFDW26]KAB7609823.1 hypothetical protein F9L33_15490 [Amylibacter sp. SFDW26]
MDYVDRFKTREEYLKEEKKEYISDKELKLFNEYTAEETKIIEELSKHGFHVIALDSIGRKKMLTKEMAIVLSGLISADLHQIVFNSLLHALKSPIARGIANKPILKLLSDENSIRKLSNYNHATIYSFGHVITPVVEPTDLPQLETLMEDLKNGPLTAMRNGIFEAILRIDKKNAAHHLKRAFDEDDEELLYSSFLAVKKLKLDVLMPEIVALTSDDDKFVRREATKVMKALSKGKTLQ